MDKNKQKNKRNGFISSSVIYAFFIVFLILLVYLLSNYSNIRFLLDRINYGIRNNAISNANGDINLYVYINDGDGFTLKNSVPLVGYEFRSDSYCTDNKGNRGSATIGFKDGEIIINATKPKTVCYAYFTKNEGDIILNVYAKESEKSEKKYVDKIPDSNYLLTSATCTKKAIINFDETTRKFNIKTQDKTVCNAIFTKKEQKVAISYFVEDASGTKVYENFKYNQYNTYPTDYTYYGYTCENKTVITNDSVNNKLIYEDAIKDNCEIYFRGGTNKVNMLYMKEGATGEVGFTAGKLYTNTINAPKTGFKYVGFKCLADGNIVFNDGVITGTSAQQDTCYIYFDKYNSNATINYYLQDSKGNYIEVSSIPNKGYVYNKQKSTCTNGSLISIVDNIAYINGDDNCKVYFDIE